MAAELRFNGGPLPASLIIRHQCDLRTFVNGADVTPTRWTVYASGSLVAHGNSSHIIFTPVSAVPHQVSATVVGEYGLYSTLSATLNVVSGYGIAAIEVKWSKYQFAPGELILATITATDSNGQPPRQTDWSILRNNVLVQAGVGPLVQLLAPDSGLYRLTGTATCLDQSVMSFDSAVHVVGSINVRHSVPVPPPNGTLIFLGDVFSDQITGPAPNPASFPYQLLTHTQDIYFLPGTTHWVAEAVNLETGATIPPEVVVRTKAGNWALNGFPGGLQTEEIGYDYQIGMPMLPVPADYRVKLTIDGWVPRAEALQSFNFRLRIRCYRQAETIYRYGRCDHSQHVGGAGKRARRLAALFTSLNAQLDVNSGLNRMGTGDRVIAYTTPDPTNIPAMTLDTSGAPHPVPYDTGMFFTDSNTYAVYESTGEPDLYAKCVAGIEGIRPAYVSLLTFPHGTPLINNRVKRAYGNLLVYLVDGSIYAGSTVTATVWKSGSSRGQSYTGTVAQTVYANADQTAARVLSIPVDLNDYQFDETGIVVDFSVDETAATESSLPNPPPLPVASELYFYSKQFSPGLSFDGACYSGPEAVSIFDSGLSGKANVIVGCHDTQCGPVGLYCYTPIFGTSTGTVLVSDLLAGASCGVTDSGPFFLFAPAIHYHVTFTFTSQSTHAGALVNLLPHPSITNILADPTVDVNAAHLDIAVGANTVDFWFDLLDETRKDIIVTLQFSGGNAGELDGVQLKYDLTPSVYIDTFYGPDSVWNPGICPGYDQFINIVFKQNNGLPCIRLNQIGDMVITNITSADLVGSYVNFDCTAGPTIFVDGGPFGFCNAPEGDANGLGVVNFGCNLNGTPATSTFNVYAWVGAVQLPAMQVTKNITWP